MVVVVLSHCLPIGFEGISSGSRGSGGVSSGSVMAIEPLFALVSSIALHGRARDALHSLDRLPPILSPLEKLT